MALKLETKFIEGTNNQYSIRNDGVVIQHFIRHANIHSNCIIYKDKIVPIKYDKNIPKVHLYLKNKAKFKRNLDNLVYEYFVEDSNYNFHKKIEFKDGNSLNLHYTNLISTHKYTNKIGVKRCATNKENNDKMVEEIERRYVARNLKISCADLTEEAYEEYKILLKVKRLIAKKSNCSIHSIK